MCHSFPRNHNEWSSCFQFSERTAKCIIKVIHWKFIHLCSPWLIQESLCIFIYSLHKTDLYDLFMNQTLDEMNSWMQESQRWGQNTYMYLQLHLSILYSIVLWCVLLCPFWSLKTPIFIHYNCILQNVSFCGRKSYRFGMTWRWVICISVYICRSCRMGILL